MQEIGGYFELDTYCGEEYYPNAVALNCGRNAIAYVVQARKYKKVYVPTFCCESVTEGVHKGGAMSATYEIDESFRPIFHHALMPHEAVLVVNYYGQLSNEEILSYKKRWQRLILDNTQAFFHHPANGVDSVYSCRKFFGVPDGAYLASKIRLPNEPELDVSTERMQFVLGRYEEPASKYYSLAANNNDRFSDIPIKYMSKLTHNLLRGINYDATKKRRTENASYLHSRLGKMNEIKYQVADGAFMYPFYYGATIGRSLRDYLHQHKIYVPCLWPDVLKREAEDSQAYRLADNIVPLPCDQRYGQEEMKYIVEKVEEFLREGERV